MMMEIMPSCFRYYTLEALEVDKGPVLTRKDNQAVLAPTPLLRTVVSFKLQTKNLGLLAPTLNVGCHMTFLPEVLNNKKCQ